MQSVSNAKEGSIVVVVKENENEELLTSGMIRCRSIDFEILKLFKNTVNGYL